MELYYRGFADISEAKSREARRACFRYALGERMAKVGIVLPRSGKGPSVEDYDEYIAIGQNGKPFFTKPPLEAVKFSVSHSGRFWACAFHDAEIGLDIEDIEYRNIDNQRMMGIASRFFLPEEENYLREAADDGKLKEKFFEIWTRKEACLKYRGFTLARGLRKFPVLKDDLGDSVVKTIKTAPGFACAICVKQVPEA